MVERYRPKSAPPPEETPKGFPGVAVETEPVTELSDNTDFRRGETIAKEFLNKLTGG